MKSVTDDILHVDWEQVRLKPALSGLISMLLVVTSVLPQNDTAVAIAFLISGVLMVAFNNANYTLFAAFLTAMLVFGQRLAQADAFEAGWERLLATIVGAAIAIAVTAIALSLTVKRSATTATEPESASGPMVRPLPTTTKERTRHERQRHTF